MIVLVFGFIGSIAIPIAGFTLGSIFPFTVTLLGINDVPFGMTSVKVHLMQVRSHYSLK